MRIGFALTAVFTALLAASVAAQSSEKKVKMQDLPRPVQEAVKEQSRGATLRGLAQEVEDGKTLYEAEMTIGGHSKDVTFDQQGKIVSVEEQTDLESIPAAARAAIQKAVGNRKLLMVEKVTAGDATAYEAHFRTGLKTSEIKVDANGTIVK